MLGKDPFSCPVSVVMVTTVSTGRLIENIPFFICRYEHYMIPCVCVCVCVSVCVCVWGGRAYCDGANVLEVL